MFRRCGRQAWRLGSTSFLPVLAPKTRFLHEQLAPLSPHLNQSLIRLAKEKYETRMPEKLFDLLRDKLYLYYAYEEQLDTDLSVEDRRRTAVAKGKLSKYMYPFEQFCRKLVELKETAEIIKMIDDPDEKEAMWELEKELVASVEACESQMFEEIVKPPVDNDTNVIIEIRAGVGGAEASLFAEELANMYQNFSDKQGWKFEVMDTYIGEHGGYREYTAGISGGGDSGLGIFGSLQFETGAHRVQRVPATESSGRLHTSTATVAVLPEMKDVDVDLRPQDIRIDLYRSSGPGGQHVNVTDSAVRLTHIPSGIVVAIQDERSQHKNKDKAMRLLRAKLYEREKSKQLSQRQEMRQQQIGSGDRSEKIRTYNYPQNRITDHRINLSLFGIDKMMAGDLCMDFATQLTEAKTKQELENLLDDPTSLGF